MSGRDGQPGRGAPSDQDLRSRDDLLSLAEHSAGIGVWDVDLASDLVRGTPQFFRIMGLEPTDRPLPIETFRRLRHPDDRSRVVQGFRDAVDSGSDSYEIEYRIRRPDGETRWIFGRGRVIRDGAGKPVRYSGVDIDITERKRAEAALAESRERLRLAQEAAGIGTWDWDIVTGALSWSDQHWRLHGLVKGDRDPTYETWRLAIHPEDRDRAAAAVAEAIAAKSPYRAEYRVLPENGIVRWVAARGTVIADEVGRPVRLLGVAVDVTEQRTVAEGLNRLNQELERRVRERTAELEAEAAHRTEIEARLHQAQKMEAVGQLTGGIAHDFNNLLTVILGNLDMLEQRLHGLASNLSPARARELFQKPVEVARRGAQNAAQLTHRLLAFSRRQPLEPRPLDLNRLVSGMSELIARTLTETIRVETRLADGSCPIFVDSNQLESALLNLVVNARDAMPGGGVVTISTSKLEIGDAMAAAAEVAPGRYVKLSVTDTGTGIPEELHERVFEPFFTTKHVGAGSGLGLSMVYGFVRQSGGHVQIESAIGRGTTIVIHFPELLSGAKDMPFARSAEALSEDLPGARPGETILLVEDNEDVRDYAVSALEELGYRVLVSPDGPSALYLLGSRGAQHIDLLFTDVVLPGGMSGRALADAAAAQRPGMPVLFTSGYTPAAMAEQSRVVPGDAVLMLAKPYTLESLAAKVRKAIDAGAPRGTVVPLRSAGGPAPA